MSAPTIEILSCFSNIIGIRGGCENIDSTSGFYANDIEISSDFINQIITREFTGVKDFHDRKLAFAIKQVVAEAKSFLTPNFRVGTLLDNYRVGQFQDDLKLIAGDGNYKGINIDLWNCSSYLDMFVSEIALQTERTGNVDVLIFDLIQNKLLETKTVACVANEIVRIYPQITFKSDRQKLNLLFCYDSTGISSNSTYLRGGNDCASCNGGYYSVTNPYEFISPVKIAAGDPKIKANLKYGQDTGGMSIVHSLQCNHESWMCSYSNMMAMAILYRYGINVIEFALTTSVNTRINTTLNINSEQLKERLSIYTQRYNEQMTTMLANIKTPTDKDCFMCRENVRHLSFAM